MCERLSEFTETLSGYASGFDAALLTATQASQALEAVTRIIDTGDPFLAAIATKGEAVVGVAHPGRRPRGVQRTALEWLCPDCTRLGCPSVARLEIDHRIDWADSHLTVFDLLDRLCDHDHDLKTREGWALVPGTGKRPMVPPDDPRHPRNAAAGERSPSEDSHDPASAA